MFLQERLIAVCSCPVTINTASWIWRLEITWTLKFTHWSRIFCAIQLVADGFQLIDSHWSLVLFRTIIRLKKVEIPPDQSSTEKKDFRRKSDSICLVYKNDQIFWTDHIVFSLALNSPIMSKNKGCHFRCLHNYRNSYHWRDTLEFIP